MISETSANHVRRLLAQGTLSMRTIARMTGTSRGTVAAIAHGRRRPHRADQGGSRKQGKEPLGPLERCPECGGLAHAPCRACRIRRAMGFKVDDRSNPTREEPLRVELSGEFRRRYEEVRARRIREGWVD